MKKVSCGLLVFFVCFILSSCTSRLQPQYNLPSQDLNAEKAEGFTRVLFYSKSDLLYWLLFGLDNSDQVDIEIDHLNVGSIKPGEYVQIDLQPQLYTFQLTHHDAIAITNDYEIEISGPEMYIRVWSGAVTTEYGFEQELPKNFKRKYKAAY